MQYSLAELLVPERMDIPGLNKFISSNIKCFICCNQPLRYRNGTLCEGCMFRSHSTHNKKGNKLRVACGIGFSSFLGIYEARLINEVGRTNIAYGWMHPEIRYVLPVMPWEDFFGNPREILDHWEMHHYVNMYNDLCVIRATEKEHARFEAMMRRGDPYLIRILKMSRERSPDMDLGTIIPKSDMDEYYSLWKKNSAGFWVLKSGDALREIYEASGKIKFSGNEIRIL